jgi:hypothetical protein
MRNKIDVTELHDDAVYHSVLHNGWLFDAMVVEHGIKTVYVFQSSSLKTNESSQFRLWYNQRCDGWIAASSKWL